MKRILLLVLMTASFILVSAFWSTEDPSAKTSIEFIKGNWADVIKKAKAENKVIFIDVYATWCGPCKLLKKTTFQNEELGEFFNANFVNAAFDGETEEGQKLMEQYGIRSYPTMLFINPDGTIRKAAVGYHTANQLLKVAKGSLN